MYEVANKSKHLFVVLADDKDLAGVVRSIIREGYRCVCVCGDSSPFMPVSGTVMEQATATLTNWKQISQWDESALRQSPRTPEPTFFPRTAYPYSVLKLQLADNIVLSAAQHTQLQNVMSNSVLRLPVFKMQQDTATLDVYVHINTTSTSPTERQRGVERAFRSTPLLLDWVSGLTTAIVTDVSAQTRNGSGGSFVRESPPALLPVDSLEWESRPPVRTFSNVPNPAFTRLLQRNPTMFEELCSEFKRLDSQIVVRLRKQFLELHHTSLSDRDALHVVLDSFLTDNVAETTVVLPLHYLTPADDRDQQLSAVTELKQVSVQGGCYHIDKAGYDNSRLVFPETSSTWRWSRSMTDAIARAIGMELFGVKRSPTNPLHHIAMIRIDPGLDMEQRFNTVREICERGVLEVDGHEYEVERCLTKDTTITMVRNKTNMAVAPYIESAEKTLQSLAAWTRQHTEDLQQDSEQDSELSSDQLSEEDDSE
jgi:hypothetical protein